MTRISNSIALVVALSLSIFSAVDRTRTAPARNTHPATITNSLRWGHLPDGRPGLIDAGGYVIAPGPYHHIVSTSLLTDRLLVDMATPDQIAAFSATGFRSSPVRHRYAGKPAVDGFGAIEAIIALRPDLVLMHSFGGSSRLDKLRAVGLTVFDLGELRGASTLGPTAEVVGIFIGDQERGRAFGATFNARLARVAAPLGATPRRSALFVSVIAGHVYGGTIGTSYHDVLAAAGLDDVAQNSHRDWPEYRSDDLIRMAPDLLVVKQGAAAAACSHPGLQRLLACQIAGHVLEIAAGLLDEPGPAMLDAAELLFSLAYPHAH